MRDDLFKLIFDNTYQFIALLDPQGRVLQVNETALAFAGVTHEQVVGQLAWETPWFPEEVKDAVRQAAQGAFVRYEMDIMGVGGQEMAIDFSLRSIVNKAAGLTYLVAEGRDITKHRQVERALRQSEARFARLFYTSPVPVILTTLAEGRFLDLNVKAELASGFSREEVLGRTTLELGIWTERPLGGRSGILKRLEEQVELRDIEMVLRRKDGELRQVLASFEVLEEQGEPSLLTTLVDVTERYQMEKQLRESENRFRSAFHDAATGMAVVAPDGRLLDVNASVCKMFGYSRDELLALRIHHITHPDDLEADLAKVQQLLSGQLTSYQLEKRYLHKEGHVVWGLLSGSVVRHEDGSAKYLIAQVQDITARKHYEEQVFVMVYRDELTGLHNRRHFFEQAPKQLARARQRSWPLALTYLDLNGFKGINDTLGHQAGDDLLKQVAQEFRHALREDDLLTRFGGDEFVALLLNTTEREAQRAAERLIACVQRSFSSPRLSGHTGVSVGVVVAPYGVPDIETLLKQADGAMYRAKGRKAREPYAVEVVRLDATSALK